MALAFAQNKETYIVLGVVVIIIIALFIMAKNQHESFANTPVPTPDTASKLESQILAKYKSDISGKSTADLQDLVARMRLRLDKFGLYPDGSSPDLSRYALKSEVAPNAGQCIVATATDRDKYISKSDLPDPAPKVDLNKYVLKSSIPPEKICPPQQEIDYSKYVLKSSLPPPQKCPPCICPKVKVSAGLCQKCPPPPKCPPPQPCDQAVCPAVQACPAVPACPAPKACPNQTGKTFYDVKYIKVPTIITKTITVDSNGNVLNQKLQTDANVASEDIGAPNPSESSHSAMATTITSAPTQSSAGSSSYSSILNMLTGENTPTPTPRYTITPNPSQLMNFASNQAIPVSTINPATSNQYQYFNPDLNSEFKKSGIYGYPGKW